MAEAAKALSQPAGAAAQSAQPSPLHQVASATFHALAGGAAIASNSGGLDGPAMALLRTLCLASGAVLHVAPWPTFNEIRSAKSTLNYHVAPYASTLVNHLVNGYYAGMRGDYTLILHRAIGIGLNLWYVFTFLRYCPPARLGDTKRFLKQCLWVILFVVAELHLMLPMFGMEDSFGEHLALIAAITGIAKAASPLATVREVIAQGDSSSLPFGLCFVMAIQCAAWTVYGYVKDDWSTGIHNGVGAVLCCFQLALIWYYPNKRKLAGNVEMSTFSSSNKEAKAEPPLPLSSKGGDDITNKVEGRISPGTLSKCEFSARYFLITAPLLLFLGVISLLLSFLCFRLCSRLRCRGTVVSNSDLQQLIFLL
jgi:Sugar efflux transporter for intercellular exchange